MTKRRLPIASAASVLFVVSLLVSLNGAANETTLRAELEPLAFLVGHCWSGEFPDDRGTDIHCFMPVFGGAHLRDVHALLGGPTLYRGETLYSWDGSAEEIRFVYWNSLGGVSNGDAQPVDGGIDFPTETYNGPDGQQVRVETYWRFVGNEAYDSVTIEKYADGRKRERSVRYHKQPFVEDPAAVVSISP